MIVIMTIGLAMIIPIIFPWYYHEYKYIFLYSIPLSYLTIGLTVIVSCIPIVYSRNGKFPWYCHDIPISIKIMLNSTSKLIKIVGPAAISIDYIIACNIYIMIVEHIIPLGNYSLNICIIYYVYSLRTYMTYS